MSLRLGGKLPRRPFDFNLGPFLYCGTAPSRSGGITTLPEQADIVVVGGGPAGATLAYELARRGLRPLLLEKDRLPRYKTCGGGVQERVARLVGADLRPVTRASVDRMIFTHRLARPVMRESPATVVHMVMRDEFDHFLVERAAKAGVEVRDRVRIDHVESAEDGFLLRTTAGPIRARIVAGADGANSPVARDCGLARDHDRDLALEGEIATPSGDHERWRTTALIDLGSLASGYGWLFPKGDQLSVGVGGPLHLRAVFKEYYERLVGYLGLSAAPVLRYTGHHLTLRRPGSPIASDRALLLGDAAGLVDPFTGEGLYGAVRSGLIAADPVVRALGGEAGALAGYQRAVDRELMPELLEARIILRVFDRMPGLCHRLIGTGSFLWRNVCRLMLGEVTYPELGRGYLRWAWRGLDRALPAP